MKGRAYRSLPVLCSLPALGLLALLVTGFAAGCQKATPTAPTGSTLTLAINPVLIASATGSAAVTATLHRPNGTPDPGAQVQFTTTLGSITPGLTTTDSNGVASAVLQGDGRLGTAHVQAFSGAVMSATIDVTVGTQAASISLSATPANVPVSGATVQLLALVRDAQGNPVPNSAVNFTTQVGTLASHGNFVFTDSSGAAHDTLTLSGTDLNSQSTDTFTVSATGGSGSSGAQNFTINILRPPLASFTFVLVSPTGRSVNFTDTSQHHPTSWVWNFGDGQTSTVQNPSHTYGAAGSYTVKLIASNSIGSSEADQIVQITQ
jgi:PKD domain